jgi:hypothetical protein
MSKIPKQCEQCQVVLQPSSDGNRLECPQCGTRFHLRPPCPYTPEVLAQAQEALDAIEAATADSDQGVKEATLWLLEEKWRRTSGHTIKIKCGCDSHSEPTQCDLCEKPLSGAEVFRLEIRDRWRRSETILEICRNHIDTHFWAGDMDAMKNQSLRLGLN